VTILVGRWAPAEFADENRSVIIEAGATHVATRLIETRDQLRSFAAHERHRPDRKREAERAATYSGVHSS
jgi:hypothetical protein